MWKIDLCTGAKSNAISHQMTISPCNHRRNSSPSALILHFVYRLECVSLMEPARGLAGLVSIFYITDGVGIRLHHRAWSKWVSVEPAARVGWEERILFQSPVCPDCISNCLGMEKFESCVITSCRWSCGVVSWVKGFSKNMRTNSIDFIVANSSVRSYF